MEDQSKHYLISGRVQGVGFRMFVRRLAAELKLKGWVRNLRDGRVEAWAQGPLPMLEEFETLLKDGPPNAVVDTLVVSAAQGAAPAGEFMIIADGEKPWPQKS
jgi:acylphosphatase